MDLMAGGIEVGAGLASASCADPPAGQTVQDHSGVHAW